MSNAESIFDLIGEFTVFNNQYQTAGDVRLGFHEVGQFFHGARASPALRAMLKNEDRFCFGPLQELLQILLSA